MNKRYKGKPKRNRATGAIVASGSLLAIIVLAVPWVDEYLDLRRDAAEIGRLETEFFEAQQRHNKMEHVGEKLNAQLEGYLQRGTGSEDVESVRERLIEIVRRAGVRLRRLEISDGETRAWAFENDDARNGSMPINEEESNFQLHTHTVELQADGPLVAVHQVLRGVADQGWLMTTKNVNLVPTSSQESFVNLDMGLVLYGLLPSEEPEEEEEYAKLEASSKLR